MNSRWLRADFGRRAHGLGLSDFQRGSIYDMIDAHDILNGRKNLIIGFSGKMTAGKTEARKVLMPLIPSAQDFSFAEAPKQKVLVDWPHLTREMVYKTKPPEVRRLLIDTGQFYRKFDEDYWLRPLRLAAEHTIGRVILVDDVRFINEATAIVEMGGLLVRIERPGAPLLDDPSETSLDSYGGFYATIANDGGLKDFHAKLGALWRDIQGWLRRYPADPGAGHTRAASAAQVPQGR